MWDVLIYNAPMLISKLTEYHQQCKCLHFVQVDLLRGWPMLFNSSYFEDVEAMLQKLIEVFTQSEMARISKQHL